MSYCLTNHANGVGGTFQNLEDAKVVIEEILSEGTQNEANWLMELVHATECGGVVNMDDQEYVQRIMKAAPGKRFEVAIECAKERIRADLRIVGATGG